MKHLEEKRGEVNFIAQVQRKNTITGRAAESFCTSEDVCSVCTEAAPHGTESRNMTGIQQPQYNCQFRFRNNAKCARSRRAI